MTNGIHPNLGELGSMLQNILHDGKNSTSQPIFLRCQLHSHPHLSHKLIKYNCDAVTVGAVMFYIAILPKALMVGFSVEMRD